MGMAISRAEWNKILNCSKKFCEVSVDFFYPTTVLLLGKRISVLHTHSSKTTDILLSLVEIVFVLVCQHSNAEKNQLKAPC